MLTCFVKFGEYRDRGFLDFDSLAHSENGIRLCTLCHPQFDNLLRPGFIFFPRNLRFFIDSEIKDYDRRLEKAQSGCRVPGRRCPTSDEYLENQINIGAVPEGAIGGLYDRYYLRDYWPRDGRDSQSLPIVGPKQWHGSPMATIMRAFLIHGSVLTGIGLISQSHRESLRELQDLYLRPDPSSTAPEEENSRRGRAEQTVIPENSSSTDRHTQDRHRALDVSRVGLVDSSANIDIQSGGTRDSAIDVATTKPYSSESPVLTSMRRKSLKRRRTSYSEDDIPKEKHIRFVLKELPWKWGPDSTSIDKATWLPHMLQWDRRGKEK